MLQAMEKLQRERDEARTQEKWHFDNYVFAQEECLKLREQRDALAEALQRIAEGSSCCACRGSAELVTIAREALAAAKGGTP